MRRFLKVMTVVALPLGTVSLAGGVAGAKGSAPAPVNATNYTISCSSFGGTLKFKPKLENNSAPFTTTVKGALFGCVATPTAGGASVDIVSSKVRGSITVDVGSDQSDCPVFLGGGPITYPASGTLTVTWKTAHRTPALSSGESVINLTSVEQETVSGTNLVAVPGSPGGVSGSGSFSGTDSGASDSINFQFGDAEQIFQDCYGPPYIARLFFNYAGGPAISLG